MARKSAKASKLSKPAKELVLEIKPLTPRLMDDFGEVLRGSWGSGCWCMYPRLTRATAAELPRPGSESDRRRTAMTRLARRRRAPGLLAYQGDQAVGWVAIAPRPELLRTESSRTTPRVDDEEVWVIPCITVRPTVRGQGVAVALVQAAVAYAAERGAPAVEAYPRAGNARTNDDNAFFGTEPLFRRAGFRVIREPLENIPKNWTPRVTMRVTID
ncbi:MAG: GNAT family N-acetyltransferase [Anaerolineales bacterium]